MSLGSTDLYAAIPSLNPNSIGEFILLSSSGIHVRSISGSGMSFNEESKASSHLQEYGKITSMA
jgi:hypothetical protein